MLIKLKICLLGLLLTAAMVSSCFAATVDHIKVVGNTTVSSDYVLSIVKTKPGEEANQQVVSDDIKAIFNLGYFSNVDAHFVTGDDGLTLEFQVTENPVVKDIQFEGNTLYKEKTLKSLLFTKPGMTFNSAFFRNDMQRLRDRFQKDGYSMTRIKNVEMHDGVVVVQLGEARVGEVVIQGNKRTKSAVIRRYFPMKTGDMLNSTTLRRSVGKLRSLGYLSDVSVGFEPTDDPNVVDLILTVTEKKSAALTLSIGYGSSSGLSGGASFRESNLGGWGRVLDVGFDKGDYSSYWINLSDPFMDKKNFSWKIGGYYTEDDELTYRDEQLDMFKFDEKRYGASVGIGRKFGRKGEFSWFVTADWHKNEVTTGPYAADNKALAAKYGVSAAEIEKFYTDNDSLNTKIFSTTLELTRDNTDPYLPYAKGDRETIGVQQAWDVLGGDKSYTKYWAEACFYYPMPWLQDFVKLGMTEDRPAVLALRIRGADSSSDSLPFSERYSIGGARTVRGYKSSYMRGVRMALANVEFRVPIDENFSIVGFYDIGRVWRGGTRAPFLPPTVDSDEWLKSPGVGIRFKSPFGLIRVDVARGDRPNGKKETEYHFGFGEMF